MGVLASVEENSSVKELINELLKTDIKVSSATKKENRIVLQHKEGRVRKVIGGKRTNFCDPRFEFMPLFFDSSIVLTKKV
jgi:hypothetical protein